MLFLLYECYLEKKVNETFNVIFRVIMILYNINPASIGESLELAVQTLVATKKSSEEFL